MKQKHQQKVKERANKSVLRLPDLEIAKSAVLNGLSSPDAQRGYRHAIDEFVGSVLFRAATVLQQNRCRPLSDALRVAKTGPRHDQSTPGSRTPPGVRGRRLWT